MRADTRADFRVSFIDTLLRHVLLAEANSQPPFSKMILSLDAAISPALSRHRNIHKARRQHARRQHDEYGIDFRRYRT